MRISTSWAQQTAVNSILDQQSRLNQTQMQLSTGKKVLTPADDPAAAARIIDLNQGIKQTEQYQSNINTARHRLTMEEGVLQGATDILQRIGSNSKILPMVLSERNSRNFFRWVLHG